MELGINMFSKESGITRVSLMWPKFMSIKEAI